MPGPDLHLHSTASDGSLAPSALVTRARELGIPAIGITDHDSVSGVAEALSAASGTDILIVPGVELSTALGDRSMHILGYHVDHTDATLLALLDDLRAIRLERAERIVYALARDGIHISLDDVLSAADGGAVGRAHVAQVLVAGGHAPSIPEAFRALLGRTAPYYVPKPVGEPADAVAWIADAGGVAVLAHPALSGVDDLIPELVSAGLEGIEAYHAAHREPERARYARLAAELGLITTGGSDFHGSDREGREMGSADVPGHVVADLAAAHRARVTPR